MNGPDLGQPKDEAVRLRDVISTLLQGQAGWAAALDREASVSVVAGAEAQDDCAVLHVHSPLDVVIGSDYVRGSKFFLYEQGLLDEYDIGWYLAAANISDVAAMGALPVALLSVIRYPSDMTDLAFEAVVAGIADSCANVGALPVGGDIGTAERLFLSASAVGVVEPGGALMRSGARPGDLVCVTGPTGTAGSALAYFRAKAQGGPSLRPEAEERLLRPWRRAQARTGEGRVLQRSGVVTSCIDTSDGLRGALEGLAASSRVGLDVDAASLPVPTAVLEVADLLGRPADGLVLGDSVDFELAFTVRPADFDALTADLSTADCGPPMVVGAVTQDAGTLAYVRARGQREGLPGEPWRNR